MTCEKKVEMEIVKNVPVPTGNICIVKGEQGLLELVSLGDYGKEKNLKADFMGLSKEINGVPHGALLPLSEKWVITVSSQYGCSMNCTFCDVPDVRSGVNASVDDIYNQVMVGISLHPEITHTKRLNVHFARMGEPSWNFDVLKAALKLQVEIKIKRGWGFHPVVSTICPDRNSNLSTFIHTWMFIKNELLDGEAGLQISVNTTDQKIRYKTMPCALPLYDISKLLKNIPVKGRKIALNFALTGAPIDADMLLSFFNPDKFLCKITPMHETSACQSHKLITKDGYTHYYPYQKVEEKLKRAGYDVIVFVPSKEEDESRITCGNAILSDYTYYSRRQIN